jgi:nucleotide-binding universal stress UspA family protein
MKNILFPIAAERDTHWSVDYLIRMHREEPVRVHLLSVQPSLNGHVRMFFGDDDIRHFHREDGEKDLFPVQEQLSAAGVSHVCHIAVGSSAATIAEFARRFQCEQVVMGPAVSRGLLSGVLIGGLAQQVAHLLETMGTACQVI